MPFKKALKVYSSKDFLEIFMRIIYSEGHQHLNTGFLKVSFPRIVLLLLLFYETINRRKNCSL